jgi:hypothetical protein
MRVIVFILKVEGCRIQNSVSVVFNKNHIVITGALSMEVFVLCA